MYQKLINRLRDALGQHIRVNYGMELGIVWERPPTLAMGEAASPVCFELAKRLKKAPRQIALEIAGRFPKVEGIERVEMAGGGYLNAYFDRGVFWAELSLGELGTEPKRDFKTPGPEDRQDRKKIIVEHTSINPNKAAHIGHVRNAVLGDTLVRTLRYAGSRVQIQNYIDNTGVQVADVVIGFLHLEQRTPIGVKMLSSEPRFDYYCWDLYAKATQFFAENKDRAAKLRGDTLKAIEEDRGEDAEVAQVVAETIVNCHLRTMARLGIHYELLARESEILHLKFWDAAFAMLKQSGAIHLATSGKMSGCWILPWKAEEKTETNRESAEANQSHAQPGEDENEQDKIIVRSNGTVTYVGKDIAYQLWKFGLLGKDFHYRKWPNAPEGGAVWATTSGKDDASAPHFREAAETVYNVIDARQSYPQEVVAEGLRRLGHVKQAEQSIHLSYERVTLTARCAQEMGYQLSAEEATKPFVEVSGRRGLGVKADDLIDRLEAAALAEVQMRHPASAESSGPSGWTDEQRQRTAHDIAVGALRYFLLKYTRNAIIAFDFQDALSFEGETGPYCQYAVVRARGIWRKDAEKSLDHLRKAPTTTELAPAPAVPSYLKGATNDDLWELLLTAGSLDYAVQAAMATQEPAFVAKFAFQLAQSFNNFYHKYHILSETDEQKRAFLLRLTGLVEARLVRALFLLGIEAPEKM